MRNVIAVFSLSFMIGTMAGAFSAAHAQPQPTAEGAGATAQPQVPAAVSNPAGETPSLNGTPATTKNMPTGKVTPPGGASNESAYPSIMRNSAGKIDSYLVKDAPLPTDFVMGKTTAPLVMIEYASLSCPHCAHFSSAILPTLQKDFIDTGRLRYIMRPFPLNEPALKGAMLLECVGEKGGADKYYLFAHVLFDAQSKWAMNNDWLSGLGTIATVGGMSQDDFKSCVNNTERETKLLKAKKLSIDELHVPHTPYIIIGGEAYNGDVTPEAMSKFIDAKLEHMKR